MARWLGECPGPGEPAHGLRGPGPGPGPRGKLRGSPRAVLAGASCEHSQWSLVPPGPLS
jgi:hypothetical protein